IHRHDPRTRILVFSMHGDPAIVARTLEAGAHGYVIKDTSSDELVRAFEQVMAGTPYLNGDLAMKVALARTGLKRNPLDDLTPRQLETLTLLAKGKPYGEIAKDLNLSYKTVANVCSELKHKLAAKNLPDLIRIAVQPVPDPPGRTPRTPATVRSHRHCQNFPSGFGKTRRRQGVARAEQSRIVKFGRTSVALVGGGVDAYTGGGLQQSSHGRCNRGNDRRDSGDAYAGRGTAAGGIAGGSDRGGRD